MPTGTTLPAMEPANFFHFSVSGPEIELRVGMIDVFAIGTFASKAREQLQRGQVASPAKLKVDITHRFFMSPRGFELLREKVNEMAQLMDDLAAAAAKAEGETLR